MPLRPNIIERTLFYTLNLAPGISADQFGGPAFFIVAAAIQLNMFETLGAAPETADGLANKLEIDRRGTHFMLDALESLGYVRRHGNAYDLTRMSRKWLTDGGDINFSPFFLYWAALMEHFMPKLADTLRTGEPETHQYEWIENQPEVSRYFQEGMIAIAKFVGDDIAKMIPVPAGGGVVLDVGGGHGTYAVALCKQHPNLSAVIFDSPQALATGRQAIKDAGMDGRISVAEGDILKDDPGTDYDIALLFNVVHGFREEGNLDMLRRVGKALKPGGLLVIAEQTPDSAPLPVMKAITRILGVAYYHMLGGQMYDYETISGWLSQTGYRDIRRKTVTKVGSLLIFGTKA